MRNVCGTILLLLIPGWLVAAPVAWLAEDGGNGHLYEVVVAGDGAWPTWFTANDAAVAMGGYLATITSEAEYDFILSVSPLNAFIGGHLGANTNGPYIGGYQALAPEETDDQRRAGWSWVTGEPWVYVPWGAGEPNNWTGEANQWEGEQYLHIRPKEFGWNDIYGTYHELNSFVVEWDTHVPEPATFPLVLIGAALFSLRFLRPAKKRAGP
jgi:hypothetical protein